VSLLAHLQASFFWLWSNTTPKAEKSHTTALKELKK